MYLHSLETERVIEDCKLKDFFEEHPEQKPAFSMAVSIIHELHYDSCAVIETLAGEPVENLPLNLLYIAVNMQIGEIDPEEYFHLYVIINRLVKDDPDVFFAEFIKAYISSEV